MSTSRYSKTSATSSINVLIIDHDRDQADSLAGLLVQQGCQVAVAYRIDGAFQRLDEFDANVALIDIRLGTENGFDLVRQLSQSHPDILCVMMTADAGLDNAIQSIQAGAFDFLRKPLSPASLMSTLGRCGDRLRLEREKEAELAQQALELRYRSMTDDVLDSSQVGLFILDAQFQIVWLNQAIERYFGVCREDLIGRDKRQVMREHICDIFEDGDRFREKVFATYDDNSYVESFECHVLPRDDRQELWLEYYSQPILSGLYAGGRVEHYYDITERKKTDLKIQESNTVLEAITRMQRDFLVEVDPRQSFETLLAMLLEVTSCEYGFIGEILHDSEGQPYLKTHAITNIAWNEETLALYEENQASGLEFHNLDTLFGVVIKTGEAIIANDAPNDPRRGGIPAEHPPLNAFLGLPFSYGGELIGMIGLANRVHGFEEGIIDLLAPIQATCACLVQAYRLETRRKVAEERSKKWQKELLARKDRETELAQAKLAKVRDELVRNTRLATIGQMTASIAHEIRNPLGAVRNAAYYLKRINNSDNPKVLKYLDIIDNEVNAANNVIGGIQALTRSKKPIKQSFDLAALVRELFEATNACEALTLQLISNPNPFPVEADRGQLHQLIRNLISNGMQAMKRSGNLTIELREDGDHDLMLVRDNGPGVKPEMRPYLFDALFTTEAKGTGLGLTICRQIAEHHSGTIELQDQEGPGATFCIRLPKPNTDK